MRLDDYDVGAMGLSSGNSSGLTSGNSSANVEPDDEVEGHAFTS
jgi:hypothetical protein